MAEGILSYRSIADLNAAAAAIARSPAARQAVGVVGIPRSGILFASLVALHGHLPITDVRGLLRGEAFDSGARLAAGAVLPPGPVLVVDDSVNSGSALAAVKAHLEAASLDRTIYYGAAYVSDHGASLVDVYAERVAWPRVFEWNLMHHAILGEACLDLDGVLCVDPPAGLEEDESAYRHFLETAEPLLTPSVPVGHIVTSRLERFRPETEDWLANAGVRYQTLEMLDVPTAAERRRFQSHAMFKAGVYRSRVSALFVESEPYQAAAIASLAGKPCYCSGDRAMYYPTTLEALRGSPLPTALEIVGVRRARAFVGRRARYAKASLGRHWSRY